MSMMSVVVGACFSSPFFVPSSSLISSFNSKIPVPDDPGISKESFCSVAWEVVSSDAGGRFCPWSAADELSGVTVWVNRAVRSESVTSSAISPLGSEPDVVGGTLIEEVCSSRTDGDGTCKGKTDCKKLTTASFCDTGRLCVAADACRTGGSSVTADVDASGLSATGLGTFPCFSFFREARAAFRASNCCLL